MNQKSLFGMSNHDGTRTFTPARRSDKATSHKAAAKVDLSKSQNLFMDTLAAMGNIPRTANEVAAKAIPIDNDRAIAKTFQRRETLRKRAGELVKLGRIIECQARECKISGNDATTYEVANNG